MRKPGGASRWLPRLLGPLVLVIILARLDLTDIAAAFERVSMAPVVGACLIVLPTLLLRSWRWRILVEAAGTEIGAIESINAYAFSIVVGAATPGRLGELIKIGYLRNKDAPTSVAVLTVALDRLFDLVFLFIVGVGGLAALAVGRAWQVVLPALLGAVVLCWVVVRCVLGSRGRRVLAVLSSRLLPESLSQRVLSSLETTVSLAKQFSSSTLTAAGVLTAVTWLITYLAVYLCAVGLGFDVPFLDICGVTAVSSLVTFLPISILGLGTRDVSLIALLAPYGVPAAGAVALSALYLGITLWLVLVCSFALFTPAATSWRRSA